MDIKELDIEFLSAEVDKYVQSLKAFKEAQAFLDKLKSLKQLDHDLGDKIEALKSSATSLSGQNEEAQASIGTAFQEADRIIDKAGDDAEALLEKAREKAAGIIQQAKEAAEREKKPLLDEEENLKIRIKDLNKTLNILRSDLETLRKQREDLARSNEGLREQKRKLLEAFKE